MAASKTDIGWRTGVVCCVKNIATKTGTFIKFEVQVDDRQGSFKASRLCKPVLIPGGDLYQWVRVCKVPLAEIDSTIKPSLFLNKRLKVFVVQRGDFYNISNWKEA